MPTSTYSQIPALIAYLTKVNPASVLDIGVGNGKMGFIVRDYLDVMLGQSYKKAEWKIRLDGIEVFGDYIQEHQKNIYNNIFIGDAFEVIDTLENYDLIILGDVLEHFEKEKAWTFLHKCMCHCNGSTIMNIPLGEGWTQPAIYNNEHERHLSFWRLEEFAPFAEMHELFHYEGIGDYGCLLLQKNKYVAHMAEHKVGALISQGRVGEALAYLHPLMPDVPSNLAWEYLYLDLFLKSERVEDAVHRLEKIVEVFPNEQLAKGYLATLKEVQERSQQRAC